MLTSQFKESRCNSYECALRDLSDHDGLIGSGATGGNREIALIFRSHFREQFAAGLLSHPDGTAEIALPTSLTRPNSAALLLVFVWRMVRAPRVCWEGG